MAKAPVTTKAPATKAANAATPVSAKARTAFVKAYKLGESSVVTKARIIGESIASGATVGKVTESLRDALVAQDLIVPKSFSASVTHYNTAYTCANTLGVVASDAALHALYQISTGVVKAAEREAFVTYHSTNGSTPEQIVASVRDLIAKARATKKNTPKADRDADLAEHVAELETEVGASPIADLAAILKQAGAILDVLADNDDDAYAEAVAMLVTFNARFIADED